MLTRSNAQRLAAWVNTHDGGVPQPRARVVHSPEYGPVVIVRSIAWEGESGTWVNEEHTAHSVAEACVILEY